MSRRTAFAALLALCSCASGTPAAITTARADLPVPAPPAPAAAAAPDPPASAARALPPAVPAPPRQTKTGPRSEKLPNGLWNPMPGGLLAGYSADTGLDIAGSPRPIYALAAGTLDYSERGHTLWTGRRDSPYTIRFELDEPIPYRGRRVTHVYYGHLSKLAFAQPEGAPERRHVEGGEYLGESGVARGSPHLHVGLLLDGDVTQYEGTYLDYDDILVVLGGLRNKTRLPVLPPR